MSVNEMRRAFASGYTNQTTTMSELKMTLINDIQSYSKGTLK